MPPATSDVVLLECPRCWAAGRWNRQLAPAGPGPCRCGSKAWRPYQRQPGDDLEEFETKEEDDDGA